MKQNPKSITTEIIRDYLTRFYLDETELRRLVVDMASLVKEGAKTPKIKYWVGLKNGIIYETTDLNTVIAEENSGNLIIQLLIIFAETNNSVENQPPRRIIVHFSRGRIQREVDVIHLGDDWFNLNYEGISYRIKDKTRDATLKSIKAIEERLQKLKRWHSFAPKFSINRHSITNQLFSLPILAFLLYALSAQLDMRESWGYSSFENTPTFLGGATLGSLILIASILAVNIMLLLINWIIPPTVIAIGDEKIQSKKSQSLREYIFWSVIVATIIGVVVNLITR